MDSGKAFGIGNSDEVGFCLRTWIEICALHGALCRANQASVFEASQLNWF